MTTPLETYKHIRDFESDYDGAQQQLRGAASLWILAGFGALSYVLFQSTVQTNPPPADLLSFAGATVCWLAVVGLSCLWLIDQEVYQRLLHSAFLYGLYLEWNDASLPQIRSVLFVDSRNVSFRLSLFYLLPIIVFFCVLFVFTVDAKSCATDHKLFISCATMENLIVVYRASVFIVIGYIGYRIVMSRRLLQDMGSRYPEAFRTYFAGDGVAQRISQGPGTPPQP